MSDQLTPLELIQNKNLKIDAMQSLLDQMAEALDISNNQLDIINMAIYDDRRVLSNIQEVFTRNNLALEAYEAFKKGE